MPSPPCAATHSGRKHRHRQPAPTPSAHQARVQMSSTLTAPEPPASRSTAPTKWPGTAAWRSSVGALLTVLTLACVLLGLSPRLANGATAPADSNPDTASAPQPSPAHDAHSDPPSAAGPVEPAAGPPELSTAGVVGQPVTPDPSGPGQSGDGTSEHEPAPSVTSAEHGSPTPQGPFAPVTTSQPDGGAAPVSGGEVEPAPSHQPSPPPPASDIGSDGGADYLEPAATPNPPPPLSSTIPTMPTVASNHTVTSIPTVTATTTSSTVTAAAGAVTSGATHTDIGAAPPGALAASPAATASPAGPEHLPPGLMPSESPGGMPKSGASSASPDPDASSTAAATDGTERVAIVPGVAGSGPMSDSPNGQGSAAGQDASHGPVFGEQLFGEQLFGEQLFGEQHGAVVTPGVVGPPTGRPRIVAIRALPRPVDPARPSVTLEMPWSQGLSVEIELEPGRLLGASSLWLGVVVIMLALWLPNPLGTGVHPVRGQHSPRP